MYVGEIAFTSLPDIGFAMRHSRMYYSANYGNSSKKCIEIAYINSGGINLTPVEGSKEWNVNVAMSNNNYKYMGIVSANV